MLLGYCPGVGSRVFAAATGQPRARKMLDPEEWHEIMDRLTGMLTVAASPPSPGLAVSLGPLHHSYLW